MIDDEFQLPVLAARYLADSAVPAERSARSCSTAPTAADRGSLAAARDGAGRQR